MHPGLRLSLYLWLANIASADDRLPSNLVAERIPPIPSELKQQIAPYLRLGGSSFHGWNTKGRKIIVGARDGNLSQLDTVDEPMGRKQKLSHWTETVNNGWYQPVVGKYFVFQSDKGGDEKFQYYVLDLSKEKATPQLLTDGDSRNTDFCWSHHGAMVAWSSTRRNGKDKDTYVANPAKAGSVRLLSKNEAPGWSVEDWNHNATRVLLRYRSELWSVDVKTGERSLLSPKQKAVALSHPRYAEKDSAIYGLGYLRSDFRLLVRLDVKTGAYGALTEKIPWDVETFEVSQDGATVAFVVNEDGFSRLHLLDVATQKELNVPAIPGDLISDLAWREGSQELGFSVSSYQFPKDAWSLDVETHELTRWTDRTKKGSQKAFSEAEVVHVKAEDGVSISTLVYRPEARRFPGRRPVIINIHGGPESQSRPGFRGSANFYLNEEGYALVYPNVRGSEGYGRKFAKLDNGFGREAAIADIGAVISWIRKDPALDPHRIAVMGGSYGGFMTLACLVRYHDMLRCGVDSVGIANFITFLRDTSAYRRDNRRAEYGDERKPEMREFLEKISPANHADEIRAPLMIVQGQNDPRVPVTEAEQMRDAIRANGGTVWYLMATDEGHGFHKKANVEYEFYATAMFLRENLK
jgi:dipeptidyl aminopeptidase/acylaminoacyl peptidase